MTLQVLYYSATGIDNFKRCFIFANKAIQKHCFLKQIDLKLLGTYMHSVSNLILTIPNVAAEKDLLQALEMTWEATRDMKHTLFDDLMHNHSLYC